MGSYTCSRCKIEKSVSEFYKDISRTRGHSSWCKDCAREYMRNRPPPVRNRARVNAQARAYRKKNKDKRRDLYLRYTYGIGEEDYNTLFEKQKGCCAICDRHQDELTGRLHVDHNHKTGEIRGLLCAYCNKQLIGRHTEPEPFFKAAVYLQKGHTGWFVPEKKKKKRRRR